ncbi:excalibur calcium-binding domain-containing protein [Nonomuraea sp. NPDC049480]|uniref:excalibur calcium-binding domain-containing protein n=1 Tax=Nonomuraea sp. NPDC049480 TaxID=3364353 RepID=UPI0037ADF86F
MDKPEEPPLADPGEPKASRFTTVVLVVTLVLVVLVAGVAGTVAVLMTRSPDTPLLGPATLQRLAVPLHFAPVRETKPAPCPGDQAVLDEEQKSCYLLEDGVTVGAVQQIETVREKDGQYSVRIAIAPAYKEKLVQLIDEMVVDQRQVAIVLAPEQPDQPKIVLAAPIVTQPMEGDSMSITGFTKEQADALSARLRGPTPTGTATTTGTPSGQPGGTPPATPTGTTPTTGSTPPAATGSTNPVTNAGPTPDRRYASCKDAVAAGDGPYYKGTHQEYGWYQDVDKNGVACNSADITN